MKIYYYDNISGDQRLPHNSGDYLDDAALSSLGVLTFHLPTIPEVDKLASSRNYKNRDVITVSPDALGPQYEDKVKGFFNEHLHEDEEIRYILDGTGYFDCRGADEKWVRIAVEKDDLIVLPPGIYHRFTTDEKNYIKAMRLFKEEPKWTPLYRSGDLDANEFRKTYVKSFLTSPA